MGETTNLLDSRSADTSASRPTWVRWRILGLLMAYAAVGHFNRIAMTVAGAESIIDWYGISETVMGMVYTAFLIAYTCCMTPGGWLIERVGTKKALMVMGFGLAFFATLTSLPGLIALPAGLFLAMLFPIRILAGAVSAPLHPGAARAASHWIPFPARGLANGLITCTALLGIASTYTVFGYLIDHFGWPVGFVLTGATTATLALVWTVYAKDYPAEHRSVNDQELRLIEDGDPFATPRSAASAGPSGEIAERRQRPRARIAPIADTMALLGNRSLLWLTISYAAVGYFQFMFFYWMQRYFMKLEIAKEASRNYSTILNLTMAAGMLSGGWLTDRCQAAFGVRLGRAIVPTAGLVFSAVWLLLGVGAQDLFWVVTFLALATAAIGACEASFWITAIDLGGRRGGTAAAVLNTGGNIGGFAAPTITPLVGELFGWKYAMGLASVICVAGAALWLWVDPAERCKDEARYAGTKALLPPDGDPR